MPCTAGQGTSTTPDVGPQPPLGYPPIPHSSMALSVGMLRVSQWRCGYHGPHTAATAWSILIVTCLSIGSQCSLHLAFPCVLLA